MIFVTVGTNEARFDRLLEAIDRLDVDEELVVQHGPSPVRPARARSVDYLPFDELVACVREARVVVTHAGVGSVLTALAHGVRPVTVPRLRRFGEAVDDHQLGFGRRLRARGFIDLVEDLDGLDSYLAETKRGFDHAIAADGALVRDLRAFVEASVRMPPVRAGKGR